MSYAFFYSLPRKGWCEILVVGLVPMFYLARNGDRFEW